MGWNPQNNFVVVAGNPDGIFIYSPSQGLGNLIGSWTSAAGTDPYGNSYPQGLSVTVGSISGIVFEGANFIINQSGMFLYTGTPASGNLFLALAPAAGTDAFGNTFIEGLQLGTASSNQIFGNPFANNPISVTSAISGVFEAVYEFTTTDANEMLPAFLGSVLLNTGSATKMTSVLTSPFGSTGSCILLESENDGSTDTAVISFGTITTPDNNSVLFSPVATLTPFTFLLYGGSTPLTIKTFTSSTTWTAPTGVTSAKTECWAGGGGGGGGLQISSVNIGGSGGGGGGGGEYAAEPANTVVPGDVYTVTIGAAGSSGAGASIAGSASGNASSGGVGGNTSFSGTSAVTVTAHGGGGGGGATFVLGTGNSGGSGGTKGTGSSNTIHANGGSGNTGGGGSQFASGAGGGGSGSASGTGNGGNGGNAGPGGVTYAGGTGGAAISGGGAGGTGGAVTNGGSGATSAGSSGTAPGGGAGGGAGTNLSSSSGGSGAAGQVRISYTVSGASPIVQLSISSAAGTDQFGTSYPEGIQYTNAAGFTGFIGLNTTDATTISQTGNSFSRIVSKLTTIPANDPAVGTSYRIKTWGAGSASVSAGGTITASTFGVAGPARLMLTFTNTLGAVAIFTWEAEVNCQVVASGTAGTVNTSLRATFTGLTAATSDQAQAGFASGLVVNTTSNNNIAPQWKWNTSNSGTITSYGMTFERLGP